MMERRHLSFIYKFIYKHVLNQQFGVLLYFYFFILKRATCVTFRQERSNIDNLGGSLCEFQKYQARHQMEF